MPSYGTSAVTFGECKQITQNGKNLGSWSCFVSMFLLLGEGQIASAFWMQLGDSKQVCFSWSLVFIIFYPQAHKSAVAKMPTERPNERNMFASNLE